MACAGPTNTSSRSLPNILVTGTPGVGKTTFSEELANQSGLEHLELGLLISSEKLFTEWDDEMDCSIFDEDVVLDKLENMGITKGGYIIDFHSASFLPCEWIDHIVVIRADTEPLYSRMVKKKYSARKIANNIECEVFQVVLDESIDAFGEGVITELKNNSTTDMNNNVIYVKNWLTNWNASEGDTGITS